MSGQVVRRFVEGAKPAGYHELLWDGKGTSRAGVSSGVYFYRMSTGTAGFVAVKKMMVLR